MTPQGVTATNRFFSSGVTGGVDMRMTERLITGVALGYGADRSDIGSSGTRSDATSLSASVYASARLFESTFIDASFGYGTLGYDNRRWVSGDGTLVNGRRGGNYWFGGVAASVEFKYAQTKLAPYVRADFMHASLDAYSEQGNSTQLLTYDAMKANAVSGAVGLRGSIDVPVSFGTLTRTARLEYRQTNQDGYDQAMYYSDLGSGMGSTFSQLAATTHILTGAVGLQARAPGGSPPRSNTASRAAPDRCYRRPSAPPSGCRSEGSRTADKPLKNCI